MSTTDQFWQYAEEAMLGARHSKNETEKRALLDLARSWTHAALQSEGKQLQREQHVGMGSNGKAQVAQPVSQLDE